MSEASDAEIPKNEKKRPGRAQAANVFNFYEGIAPPSTPATPEATVRALRGYLQSKQSYKFKSEFVKEMTRLYREGECTYIAAKAACLRDFDKMRPIVETHLGTPFDVTDFPMEERIKWKVFHHDLNEVWRILKSRDQPMDGDELFEATRRVLRMELKQSKAREMAMRAAITKLCGRVANHLLRGDSAQQVREFVEPQIEAIQDRFNFDFNFDFHELIEEIAAAGTN